MKSKLNILNLNTVDSLLFVEYQFFLGFIGTGEPPIQMITEVQISKEMYADFAKITNLNIHQYASFSQPLKIGTHENKLIHSSLCSERQKKNQGFDVHCCFKRCHKNIGFDLR